MGLLTLREKGTTMNTIPTTEQVRTAYVRSLLHDLMRAPGQEFDQWLAAHDAELTERVKGDAPEPQDEAPKCAKCNDKATVIIQDRGFEWYACDVHAAWEPTNQDTLAHALIVARADNRKGKR